MGVTRTDLFIRVSMLDTKPGKFVPSATTSFHKSLSMNLSTLQFATWIPLGFSRCSTHGMDVHTILALTMRYHFKEACRRGFTIFQGNSQAFSSCFQVCINTEEASRNQLVCLQALKQLPLGYVLRTEVYSGGVIH